MINVSEVYNLKDTKKYIEDVIDTNWISYSGKYVGECERILEKKLNVKHVLLTNSGTSATHCVIKSIKMKNPKCNKIYIQNNSYVAAYNMALNEYNIENITILPLDSKTLNLDMNYIKNIEKNSALLIIHNIGNILPIEEIKRERPDIIIVEDNCEGFMGKYNNKNYGCDGLSSAISFFANKHITCGEGGAFITNDTEIYNKIKSFCRHGITEHRYIHNIHGTNYRLSNINASILFSQLQNLDEIVEKKKMLYHYYKKLLKDVDKIEFQEIEDKTEPSYWLIPIRMCLSDFNYSKIHKYFNDKGVDIRPFFYDIRKHEHLKSIKVIDDNSFINNIILLPLHMYLTKEKIEYIVSIIKELIK